MNPEQEFPQDQELLYLNHAAVSPWPKRTERAVAEFARENVVHGARNYPQWIKKETQLRQQLQRLINAPSIDSIALLKNTSEALSVVAEGLNWQPGDNIVTSDQEFPSNRFPWQAQARHGVELREVALDPVSSPELALINACDVSTRILTISSVQYGSGLRLDLERLGEFCRKNKILFCVDAIQSLGAHRFDVQACHADFVMADAHKWMLGPEGIALFYCRDVWLEQLQLHQYGWHMVANAGDYDTREWQPAPNAKRFECGSPNMLGIHAFSASLSVIEDYSMNFIEEQINERMDFLFESLGNDPRFEIITPQTKSQRAGIFTFRLNDRDPAEVHKQLMTKQVICAHRFGGIRFSPHFYTTTNTLKKALDIFNVIY